MTWNGQFQPFTHRPVTRDGQTGLVFDIQRFAVHDGSGIRTLVFLKGCPLRCLWCQNPESMRREPEIVYLPTNCIDCGKCKSTCPSGAIADADLDAPAGKRALDRSRCDLCGRCLDTCYAGALNIIGRYLTVSEVLAEVERDRKFYERSAGGVTFSGGEPTAQPAFVRAACRQAQARGLHTALETCGYASWEILHSVLQFVDQVLYDLKHMDSHQHRRLTGVPNELIHENLRRVAGLGRPVRVRLPLVPGYNDSPVNVRATAAFVARLPGVQALDILPYHRLGEPKWRQLDREYALHGVTPPERDRVYELAEVAREFDIEVNIGG